MTVHERESIGDATGGTPGDGAGVCEVVIRTADELEPHLDAVVEVYDRAFREWPYDHNAAAADRFREAMRSHTSYPDFEATLLYGPGEGDADRLLGFTYGHTNAPDQWWYRQIVSHLPRKVRERVFDGAWVVVELAVDPDARRRGLGRRLLRTATTGRPNPFVVLSTVQAESAAVRMYREEGFTALVPAFQFAGSPGSWVVFARPMDH